MLLVFLLFAVLQVAGVMFVRSVVASSADDGARFGANAGREPGQGATRASELISAALTGGMAQRLPCQEERGADAVSGLPTVRVRCRGRIDSLLLPIAALVEIDSTSEALREPP